jgi:hypothetical protein
MKNGEHLLPLIASGVIWIRRGLMALGCVTLLWVAFHFLSGVISYFTY